MGEALPGLPPDLAALWRNFLAQGKSGSLTFNVKSGKVMDMEIRERVVPGMR